MRPIGHCASRRPTYLLGAAAVCGDDLGGVHDRRILIPGRIEFASEICGKRSFVDAGANGEVVAYQKGLSIAEVV